MEAYLQPLLQTPSWQRGGKTRSVLFTFLQKLSDLNLFVLVTANRKKHRVPASPQTASSRLGTVRCLRLRLTGGTRKTWRASPEVTPLIHLTCKHQRNLTTCRTARQLMWEELLPNKEVRNTFVYRDGLCVWRRLLSGLWLESSFSEHRAVNYNLPSSQQVQRADFSCLSWS